MMYVLLSQFYAANGMLIINRFEMSVCDAYKNIE